VGREGAVFGGEGIGERSEEAREEITGVLREKKKIKVDASGGVGRNRDLGLAAGEEGEDV